MSRSSGTPHTLEASLDEENREVLAALQGQSRSRSPNPRFPRGTTPPAPIRSMLGVDDTAPRHGSIAGIGVGITNPRDQAKASKRLNPADPSTWTRPHRPSSPGPGRPSFHSDLKDREIPTIQVDSGDEVQKEEDTVAMKQDNHKSSDVPVIHFAATENQKPTSDSKNQSRSPKKHKSLVAGSPTPLSLSGESNGKRRASNRSSSFSDTSDVPSITVNHASTVNEDAVLESSDEEQQDTSSDPESPEAPRGRVREQEYKDRVIPPNSQGNSAVGIPTALANVEPGISAPQSRGVRSLLEPIENSSKPSSSVSPSGFGRSGINLSDYELDPMEADIQKAKNLGLNISPVDDSIPDRHVRMIIRGDWAKLQEEAEDRNHRSRLYLTCSDLSTEATYALEWTVGTMLRDGDTLLAMYAIEDENAPKEAEGNREVIAESAKAAHDASETMETLTRQTTNLSHTSKPNSKFIPATEAGTLTGSVDARGRNKKEMERLHAMDNITENFLKLVRKTPLQIRCMIEVIHCKSPKHLILNAIDELEPTLCVVGTRGRSSLKGVLLGSFSNYLVTKSSVPVMVARKRLKKSRHAKVNSASIRLSNNLTNSIMPRQRRSLTQARID